MSDAKQIKQLLLERVADLAPHLFPNGKKEGNHWRVGSVEGEAGKSFDVCIAGQKAGLYGDFEKSEKHSNNLLDLWMQARNVDFKTALREAAEWLGLPQTKSKRTFPNTRGCHSCSATAEDARHAARHIPRCQWNCSFQLSCDSTARKAKSFAHFIRHLRAGSLQIRRGSVPLLDLPELVRQDLNRESSSETVFVPEGEKSRARVTGQARPPSATTSAHGAKAPYKTDWTPLVGRKVVFLPDNDLGGQGYAREALRRSSCNSRRRQKLRSLNFQGCPKKETASTGSRRATESHPSRSRQSCLS